MEKKIFDDIKQMSAQYKQLAKQLGLTLEELLLIVVARELIILNEKNVILP